MELTGFTSTRPDFQGSTPPSLLGALGQTAIGGLNAFIDLEIAERLGSIPNTQADVRAQSPSQDPSQPKQTASMAAASLTPLLLSAAIALFGVLVLVRT